jgi:agmatine deiminase
MEKSLKIMPAEWHLQRAVQLTWPHKNSDWAYLINEVEACFVEIAKQVVARQQLFIVSMEGERVRKFFSKEELTNIRIFEIESNDTWARDHGGITIFENGKPLLLDFTFNGWAMKFAAGLDNLITRKLFKQNAFAGSAYKNMGHFVLEGGSIESDGQGTILTTAECLLSHNRNEYLAKEEVENRLKNYLGAQRVLWLNNGFLVGDDTDSHIDTLARFCSPDTIAYVKCTNPNDEHYEALTAMEQELQAFRQLDGDPYKLVALPMASPIFDPDDNHRLPATYANFLIINSAVLFPVYNCETDQTAIVTIKTAFPEREIVPIDCSVLIRQHGSLHCVTMQYF